jgi:hypothetical protein
MLTDDVLVTAGIMDFGTMRLLLLPATLEGDRMINNSKNARYEKIFIRCCGTFNVG